MPTPNNLPVIIQVEGVELSPYFKMNQDAQIEFFDFALEIPEDVEDFVI